MQIHVDPLGGWSGDMFVAAVLDAFPQHWRLVEGAVAALKLGPGATCRLVPHRDQSLTGRRFVVAAEPELMHGDHAHGTHQHHHDHDHPHDHPHKRESDEAHSHGPHRAWADIRTMLEQSRLDGAARRHAIGIFQLLAEAEAEVHGIAPEKVSFHEVGAVDSIVDIVAAAVLIAELGADGWTSAPLPLGSGRVRTAHGILPVPAPATALLLRGLATIDDGIGGERVTPTGAAVARYLLTPAKPNGTAPRRLVGTGTGFGSRTLPGISNCLRVVVFASDGPQVESVPAAGRFGHRELGVIAFEVDDQSAEDLTHGLDHLRGLDGVHDVVQSVVFGKKGRMATHVQVLVAPAQLDATIAACFTETTTIGLRYHLVHGAALPRQFAEVDVEGHRLRVKTVARPDGQVTGKVEAGDVAAEPGHAARVALRRAGEATALAQQPFPQVGSEKL